MAKKAKRGIAAPPQAAAAIVEPPRYWEWLEFAFDRPESQTGWYFDREQLDRDFIAEPAEFVALFTATMQRSGEDLKLFSDIQVKHGLEYHLNGACGNVVGAVQHESVPEHLRDEAILSLKTLYSDCLDRFPKSVTRFSDEKRSRSKV